MLEHIHIKNIIVVDELSIDCDAGFSAITGETGAGKSIWIDAICLALGQRADAQLIRQGQDRACITLSFDISHNAQASHWLTEHELDTDDNQCLIQRSFARNGRTKITVNGYPTTTQLVRELAPLLILIHNQQQHRELLKTTFQRESIDNYADNHDLLNTLQTHHHQWQQHQEDIDSLQQQIPQREQQLDFLKHQLNELQSANIQPNEWQTLSQQHQTLHHAKAIKQTLHLALTLTTDHDEYAADTLIQQAQQSLESLPIQDEHIDNIQSLLNTANIHLQEATNELQAYYQTMNISQTELQDIEQRLSLIHDLARKHHTTPETLTDVEASLQQQINQLESVDERIATLQQLLTATEKKYHQCAKTLTKRRDQAASALSSAITKHMQTLAMTGGNIAITLIPNNQNITSYGHENITFMVQTNPGSTPAPMQDIVSGGELSRLSLALQIELATKQHTPTLIFDEVDTGISGKTASIVGRCLKQLGDHAQVLCITHLPQVASRAANHFKIHKITQGNTTTTQITALNAKQRVDEIARLIGGETITNTTKNSAKELLAATEPA